MKQLCLSDAGDAVDKRNAAPVITGGASTQGLILHVTELHFAPDKGVGQAALASHSYSAFGRRHLVAKRKT